MVAQAVEREDKEKAGMGDDAGPHVCIQYRRTSPTYLLPLFLLCLPHLHRRQKKNNKDRNVSRAKGKQTVARYQLHLLSLSLSLTLTPFYPLMPNAQLVMLCIDISIE